MKSMKHPERGYRIALSTEKYAGVADSILCYHERWDGTGYPQGIKGEEIRLAISLTLNWPILLLI
ncbi:hypothetical protein I0Q91_10475 [Halanaerobiaceae bacterium Z-7014]|uniref:HD-GYP domain-containing protein n=1 Tax=Halonatronomonas betaini TaxID=2778430 RepID=A0A931AR75_9FIRM|nr:HD domain-containing phosphohydrolase [Halonatronomonas betaini]MBF8437508.1 hypothetical protein [Halonatronomonas betaini]